MLKYFFSTLSKSIGIDLGTANTLVYVPDQGIVVNEPSIVAINVRTDQIIAIGSVAKKMVGKTPPHIELIRPLTDGVISDFEVTEKMVKYFIQNILKDTALRLLRPNIIIGVPLEVTEVERKAVEDAALSAGAREVFLVEQPMAAAIGSRLPVTEPTASMVVDIGGGTTDIAVISLGGIATYRSLRHAGDEMTTHIIQFSRDEFNLVIGEHIAEDVKIKIGSASDLGETVTMNLRGRDVVSGLPKEVQVTDEQIRRAMHKTVKLIIDNIKITLENTPPELVADIYEKGMLIAGGGALIKNVDKAINRATGIHVRIADDPLTSVVRGTGILIDDPELLKTVRLPNTEYKQKANV